MFVSYAGEIWTKLYGPNHTKFWAFDQKNGVFITFFDKELTPFLKTFVAEIIV